MLVDVSLLTFFLGGAFHLIAYILFQRLWHGDILSWGSRFGVFGISFTLGHYLESVMTSYNGHPVTRDNFLLLVKEYLFWMFIGVVESILSLYIKCIRGGPVWCYGTYIAGVMFGIIGHTIRMISMYHCGRAFNHAINEDPKKANKLVNNGIYKYMRHPGYCGWFIMAISQQLILGNQASLLIITGLYWWFFTQRIKYEESLLEKSYGAEYTEYRKKVPFAGLPFIK